MGKLRVSLVAITLSLATAAVALADKVFTNRDLKGSYAFSFQGEIVGLGPVAATGVLNADGNGNVTDAVRTISVNGVPVTETFTCTLSVNPNGTGTAICVIDNPAPGFPLVETFDIVLGKNGGDFRLVGTTPGVVVLGSGSRQ